MGRLATVIFAAFVVSPVTAAAEPTGCPVEEADEEAEVTPCPDVLAGTKLVVANVAGGVTFRITTPERTNIATLRELVREIAVVVEAHAQSRAGEPFDPTVIPPLRMRVTNVTSGVLVTVRPDRARNVALVRDQARQVEAFWTEWACVTDYMPPALSIDL